MFKKLSKLLGAALLVPFVSWAQLDAKIAQYPDVSDTHITFSYGGDIWIVPKTGGLANRLTTSKGTESFPKFSPDGSKVAFSGVYNGNSDVYVMPFQGGMPQRLTYHGMSDRMVDWYGDGNHILFASSRESEKQRYNQFYKVSVDGGLPEKLPVPYGEFGMISPDGNKIAYTPKSRAFRTWKRYKGGMATDIFTFDLASNASENISNSIYNDEFPMWTADKIYFLSDRGAHQRNNIYSYDLATKEIAQITDFSAYDVLFPSIGKDEIVFTAGGEIYLLDLSSGEFEAVSIQVSSDVTALMPRKENVKRYIQNVWPSYDGNRAVFEARGELFSVPAKDGPVINLTQSSGVAERYPAWSPDGRYVAYWSDRTGEYELTIKDLKNGGAEKTLSAYGAGYRYQLYWSPDSKKVAFVDKAMDIYVYDKEKDKTTHVDKQKSLFQYGLDNFSVSWSPDSRYLAFEKNLTNQHNAIAVFDIEEEALHQITSGFYSDNNPVFGPEGKYLYCLTNRDFDPVYSDFEGTWVYANATQLAAIPLLKETASPLAPKNDSTSVKEEEQSAKEEDKSKKSKKDKSDDADTEEDSDKVKIDWDGLERRMVVLPPSAGNYSSLGAVKGKVLYLKHPTNGSDSHQSELAYYDVEARESKTIMGNVSGYRLTANGEKALVVSQGSFGIIGIGEGKKLEDKMPTDKIEMILEPKAEWRQIFNDAWRLERDFFYDPNMHGVDWEAMRDHYGKLIDHAITREDVNYIIGELIGEISASHTYRGGGDTESTSSKSIGYLGIDWGEKDDAYFVKEIIRGAPWDSEARSPLDEAGVDISEGDFILAVNGVPIDMEKDPWAAFEDLAGETVELTVNDQASLDGSKKVMVKTLGTETRLRNLAWIEENRKRVEEATDGKIGYIYVPSTGYDGQQELARMFYAQFDKEGLIIDERFNNGGQIPDRFVELLNRKPLAFWAVRDGETWQWPQVANFGPKVMLINGWSGSGGDAFPDYFRKAGLGPLIGTRTWGGLIGISGAPSLIDGGSVTVPTFRMFDPSGEWFKEGHGVDPDIEVAEDPTALANGTDPQLEKAIEETLRLLKQQPSVQPKVPAYEVK
ncbi:S41 family peptidase [Echinicola vietnamensis]|uniref:Tricorn protease homolog n=1 Tax=Echinicola vietnamensis (strain DSM 17526 / LMG 23754 / KMM 6221) TaxID=926556 RepID=L0FYV4_ECHVK|nr:S41 family peptidase [Echinicola vietnamensis]AGA77825.1 Tol biopolymer transport system, periplasmic component-related protein [Echinicola vietnamensis DSM 17526]